METAKHVSAAIGHLSPHQVTPLMLAALLAEWRKKYSASYAYALRYALVNLLAHLVAAGTPPMKLPKVPTPPQRAVVATHEELARLLKNPTPALRLFMLLYLQAGLRFSEAMAVTPRSWDPEQHTTSVRVKGGKTRKAQVTEDIEALFRICGPDLDPDASYIDLLAGHHISESALRMQWIRHRKACGISEKVNAHDLRRSSASILYGATKDLRIVQQLLGHQRLTSTLKYIAPMDPNEARKYTELLRFDHFKSDTKQ